MDTENIIKSLLEAQRIPLDKTTHKKQQLEWKLEDYRYINRDLKKMEYNLRDTVNRQSSYSAKSVTVSNADAVGGVRLSDFGISPTRDYLSHGKLEIDESKLREKIAEDPNKLYELIGNPTADSKGKVGLSHQFRIEIANTHKVIGKRAGSAGAVNDTFTLGKNIKDMNSQIEKFENRLQMVESRLWKQFNAMESAIQRMNAQSANLMSQFGG